MIFRNCNFFLLPSQILREVQAIHDIVNTINQKLEASMLDLTALRAEITENSDAVASAVVLISALVDEIRANAGNQAAINEIANQLDAQTAALAAAVAANTPAEPPVDPVVTE
jgi:methyl-accepting chemotaxis protein